MGRARQDPAADERGLLEDPVADGREASARSGPARSLLKERGRIGSPVARRPFGRSRRAPHRGARSMPPRAARPRARRRHTRRGPRPRPGRSGTSACVSFGWSAWGSVIQAASHSRLALAPTLVRSGPMVPPRPSTAWQVTQRERRKISPPLAGSPRRGRAPGSGPVRRWPRRKAEVPRHRRAVRRKSPMRVRGRRSRGSREPPTQPRGAQLLREAVEPRSPNLPDVVARGARGRRCSCTRRCGRAPVRGGRLLGALVRGDRSRSGPP